MHIIIFINNHRSEADRTRSEGPVIRKHTKVRATMLTGLLSSQALLFASPTLLPRSSERPSRRRNIGGSHVNVQHDLVCVPRFYGPTTTKHTCIHIDPLHGDVTFRHFHIRPFGCRHVGDQKCIAVIERNALIVSLFTNTSGYSWYL